MAIGSSHRIVLEDDPTLKKEIYAELARRNTNLKKWFLGQVNEELLKEKKNNGKR